MLTPLDEPTEQQKAQIREIQQRIHSGGNVEEVIRAVRTEYLKHQGTQ
jgi:hypothetical protein